MVKTPILDSRDNRVIGFGANRTIKDNGRTDPGRRPVIGSRRWADQPHVVRSMGGFIEHGANPESNSASETFQVAGKCL
jgi:hypothetical protein